MELATLPAPPAELVLAAEVGDPDVAVDAAACVLVLDPVPVSEAEATGPVGVLSSVVPAAQPPSSAIAKMDERATS